MTGYTVSRFAQRITDEKEMLLELWQGLLLALIQGLTEFLPISSSAHLILPSAILGWPDQGLAFDVAVHVGSLLAVVVYFREDLLTMATAWLRSLWTRQANDDSRLAWAVIIGTIPAGLCGLFMGGWIEANLRSVSVIAFTTVFFGLLLGWADRRASGQARTVSLKIAVQIGLAQTLALIPGTSRSGVTMTAGLLLGLSRQQASRFSFLLSIPLITAAGLLKSVELATQGDAIPWASIMLAVAVSAITAWLCIHWFMRLIERVGFMPFVVYRLLLGAVLVLLLWLGA